MTFLHLNIYAWVPSTTPHHYIMGSVSTFKLDDISALKTFIHLSPTPHQCILISVSTFKHDDISALKHLCMGQLHHTTISLVQFQHLSKMTYLHLNIYAQVPSPHYIILGSVSTFKCGDISALKHLCVCPLYHTTISLVQFKHSSVKFFLHLNIYVWVPSATSCYPGFSFNIHA